MPQPAEPSAGQRLRRPDAGAYSPGMTSTVIETGLSIDGPTGFVPGILWEPADSSSATPLVLAGHGGGFGTNGHKRVDSIVALAEDLATEHGIATLAIDQPGCGDREGAEAEQERRRSLSVEEAIASLWTPELVQSMSDDWGASLTHLQEVRGLGAAGIGYWGLSGGTTFGLPLVATDPRISAAVLGLNGDVPLMRTHAPAVRCPVMYMMNLDDRFMTRDSALALFDNLGSENKRLVGYPGDHGENLDDARPEWGRFFARFLG